MAYLLHQLLARTALQEPDKNAIVCNNESMTYRELEETSNKLAHVLRHYGIERGDRVGIYLNKSIESVVAIFAILKAGAAYVPLDPGAPVRRVAYIIGNCGMKALVSTHKKLERLNQAMPSSSTVQCHILVDACSPDHMYGTSHTARMVSWREVLQWNRRCKLPDGMIENDLAYILYTSGSTGEPKGVMISHRASLTFVNWAYDCFQVKANDRVSNHAPLHFDLSIFDIFVSVKAGTTVILVPDELSVFPRDLANFIDDRRISIWYSVPSVLIRLVLNGNLERYRLNNLRTILFAGEVFPVKYLRQLRRLVPHAECYNLYGPTETNVCTFYHVKEIPPDRVEPFPIGKACANTEVFAVKDRQEIAGPGEVGELYVRGPSLMSGYWGMPEKTKEVMNPHPVHLSLWEEKAYRTGDLVKLDQDGNYLYLGRRDNMIKSRGYRIELGEIETVLYSHPKVEEVAVLAIPDEQIGNMIKAVVVSRNASELTQSELEYFCSQRIPQYMIPSIFEFRTSLPKTSTGKVDRTLLIRSTLEVRKDASESIIMEAYHER
jgi:L-proline---[L-prolyl-carrier protein] ligase